MRRVLPILVAFILLTACEQDSREPDIREGIVTEKYFIKGQSSTGVGMTMNGQMTVVQSSTSDEYILFIDDEDYSVSKDEWLSVEKGSRIRFEKSWSGIDILERK